MCLIGDVGNGSNKLPTVRKEIMDMCVAKSKAFLKNVASEEINRNKKEVFKNWRIFGNVQKHSSVKIFVLNNNIDQYKSFLDCIIKKLYMISANKYHFQTLL